MQNHDFKFQGCLVDVCAECAGNDEMKDIAEEDIIEEEEGEPGPICMESGDSCGLPTDTCQKSVEVNLDTVSTYLWINQGDGWVNQGDGWVNP